MSESPKTWWAPIWRGLIVDPNGKHVRALKAALALFLYIILHADRATGVVTRKEAVIARDMGLSLWTVRAWRRRLEKLGYLDARRTGRGTVMTIRRWRAVGQRHAAQSGIPVPIRAAETQRADRDDRGKPPMVSGEFRPLTASNESLLTRELSRDGGRPTERGPTREEVLASDLADGLHDHAQFRRYLSYARKHDEGLLRRCLSEARAMPAHRIKRSRAAYFEFLLKRHVFSDSTTHSAHPRD